MRRLEAGNKRVEMEGTGKRNGGSRGEKVNRLGMNVALVCIFIIVKVLATICTFNIRPTMTTSASAAATIQLPLLLFPPVSANSKQTHLFDCFPHPCLLWRLRCDLFGSSSTACYRQSTFCNNAL